jgi:hypothetical protein
MKVVHTILAASLLAASFGAAAANPSTNLTVTGTIKPVSCSLTVMGSDTYDIGSVSKASLTADSETQLTAQNKNVTVDCGTAGTNVSLTLADNNHASSTLPAAWEYGLGLASDGTTKLGHYQMRVLNAKMDGVAVKTGLALLGPNPTDWGFNDALTSEKQLAPIDDGKQLLRTTNLSFELNMRPFIQATTAFPAGLLDQEQNMAGSSTLILNYL